MNKCPNCGANSPSNNFVCAYCGFVDSKKIKQVDNNSKVISFEESLNIIQDNLEALHDINVSLI